MDIGQAPYFELLRIRLDQLSQRQRLIAENIANASTPGYTPRDLDASAFQRALDAQSGVALARTNAGHMAAGGAPQAVIVTRADSETTLDGNAVVLEEQTVRAAETRMQYETALALYQKGLQLLRMASRPPGR
ncbi:MAG: flagellar basal body rod protein FlgB [Hydrogenophilaceae bacterium]|jgi:flagellar basal-body rod protein FlgB|nr:flagellar basal body rod protein FlgB [Hydrogenophilaceae bacterium]